MISRDSGKRSSSNFENNRLSSTRISKLCNSPGFSSTSRARTFSISSANLAALVLYAQEAQCRITTRILLFVSESTFTVSSSDNNTRGVSRAKTLISSTILPDIKPSLRVEGPTCFPRRISRCSKNFAPGSAGRICTILLLFVHTCGDLRPMPVD